MSYFDQTPLRGREPTVVPVLDEGPTLLSAPRHPLRYQHSPRILLCSGTRPPGSMIHADAAEEPAGDQTAGSLRGYDAQGGPAEGGTQGHCVVGLLLITALMRSLGRRSAWRVARAMLGWPLLRWYPMAVLRSTAATAGPLRVRAW